MSKNTTNSCTGGKCNSNASNHGSIHSSRQVHSAYSAPSAQFDNVGNFFNTNQSPFGNHDSIFGSIGFGDIFDDFRPFLQGPIQANNFKNVAQDHSSRRGSFWSNILDFLGDQSHFRHNRRAYRNQPRQLPEMENEIETPSPYKWT